jgi:hypothetical protein
MRAVNNDDIRIGVLIPIGKAQWGGADPRRRVPRGPSARGNDAELDAFLREFRVVTPLDHRDPMVARPDWSW